MNPEYVDPINKATALQDQIDRIYTEIDLLLDPIYKEVIAKERAGEMNRDQLVEVMNAFPPGLHRSELRTYLRFGER